MTFTDDDVMRQKLREPFPKELIGKLPRKTKDGGTLHLDFVGHAAVTDRLNQAAPGWTFTVDETFHIGPETWVRGTMTIGGVSRPEFGDGKTPKEAISNFIRRAAMRFGVGLDLWSKEELQGGVPAEASRDGWDSEAYGEGAKGSPESSGSGEGIGVSSLSGQASSGPGPTPASQELWAEARAAGVTATKAMKALRDEGVEVASSAEITDVQLRDLMQRVNA